MLRLLIAGFLVAAAAGATDARAQSAVSFSPDSRFVLVQKNLGDQRWAIVRDQSDRSVTGNIFNPGGDAQFVWCRNLGGESYECVGNSGCTFGGCDWAPLGTVTVPESFFQLSVVGPTPRPTPKPTPQPTPPLTGLSGLLGTWDLTFKIISTFTFEFRLQRLATATGGYSIIVGKNELGDAIVVGRVQDLDPGNGLPYEYALAEKTVGVCNLYVFDQTGTDRVAGLESSAFQKANGDCGTFLGTADMTGVRVSRLASTSRATEAVNRALKRRGRAAKAEMRDATGSEIPELGALFEKIRAAGSQASK